MLHKTDETDFDAGTSEIWENCLNFSEFQMSPRQNLFRQFYAGAYGGDPLKGQEWGSD